MSAYLDALLKHISTRDVQAHKGNFGHLVIIAGSEAMIGAAILAAKAAFATGVGYVSLLTVNTFKKPLQLELPEVMVYGLPTDDGAISIDAFDDIIDYIKKKKVDTIAIGPGLGRHKTTTDLINKIIFNYCINSSIKLVIDADALTAVDAQRLHTYPDEQMVLTPHSGEFNQLCRPINLVYHPDHRERCAKEAQAWTKQIIVLKGHQSIVASKKDSYINSTGNPSMATAGVGDVLTGMIASVACQGISLFDSACLGCYIHGKAGDIANKTVGIGLTASDIIATCRSIMGENQ